MTVWEPVEDVTVLKRGDYVRVEATAVDLKPFADDDDPPPSLKECAYEGEVIALQYGEHLTLHGHQTLFLKNYRPYKVFLRRAK